MDEQNQIGRVVYSKAGRDAGKYFIIIDIIDDEYVYVSDGKLRPIEKPKKKKVKHLTFTNIEYKEIRESFLSGQMVSNSKIRRLLQSMDAGKEV